MPLKRKPTKPSPKLVAKPKPKPKVKRKPGRPDGSGAFRPTGEQREMVKLMSAIGIPERKMVHAIINPETKKGITPVSLRKHFREELDQGLVQADIKAGANLLKLTETSAAAAIFWAKCRLQWRERVSVDFAVPTEPGVSVEASVEKQAILDVARRIAFTLSMGADIATQTKPVAPKPKQPA